MYASVLRDKTIVRYGTRKNFSLKADVLGCRLSFAACTSFCFLMLLCTFI